MLTATNSESVLFVAGVDEAGRGPLAGPVFAAAVIFAPGMVPDGLADSKKLSAARRNKLEEVILREAKTCALGRVDVQDIDRLNILAASMLAMQRAVAALSISPDLVLVDGNRCPDWNWRSEAIVGGDALEPSISAASILAKEARDREMRELDLRYPGYGFARHKGYPTRLHLERLQHLGPCAIHRRSFAPVRAALRDSQFALLDVSGQSAR